MGGEAGCSLESFYSLSTWAPDGCKPIPIPPSPGVHSSSGTLSVSPGNGLWVWGTGGIAGEAGKVSSVREFA